MIEYPLKIQAAESARNKISISNNVHLDSIYKNINSQIIVGIRELTNSKMIGFVSLGSDF